MLHLVFTGNLQRHVPCPPGEYPGTCVAEVLEAAFRERLGDPVGPGAEVYVMQALSGG